MGQQSSIHCVRALARSRDNCRQFAAIVAFVMTICDLIVAFWAPFKCYSVIFTPVFGIFLEKMQVKSRYDDCVSVHDAQLYLQLGDITRKIPSSACMAAIDKWDHWHCAVIEIAPRPEALDL